ncbi:MAG: nucleoside kinase [Chloroflexota bacterium]
MFNVCRNCGAYGADKTIDPAGPWAICPACGHQHAFRMLPLLMVCGASGTGKSETCQALVGTVPEALILDADILWRPEFDTPDDNYLAFFETWLRVVKNLNQEGRPVALLCAGGIPANVEPCVERRYVGAIHYLALTCDPDEQTRRLQARPSWRGSADPAFLAQHIAYNRWLREVGPTGQPPITPLDTAHATVAETAAAVAAWIRQSLASGS